MEAIVAELRKKIQVAIELGELDSLDDAGRFQYGNLNQVFRTQNLEVFTRSRRPQRTRAIQWKRNSKQQRQLSIRHQRCLKG